MIIGFIGLGNMGAPMARNLVAAGHAVRGFDLTADCPDGVDTAHSAADAAADADVVITMLPSGAILRDVTAQIHGAMRPGSIHLDCSTVDVASAKDVAQLAAKKELLSLDAPVSGGSAGAAAGTLTFMVGGSEEAFATATPLFEVMGQKAVHCGAAGMGQAAKICNNMILGATMVATCEAFALADKIGLDRRVVFDVVSTSSGQSWSMTSYCPAPGVGPQSPSDADYRPGVAADLMLKDLKLSQDAAASAGATTPAGAMARAVYEDFVDSLGGAPKDFSALLPWFSEQ